MILRDRGLSETELFPDNHADHKVSVIRQIFWISIPRCLFSLNFGDSGQEDPEIYAEIVRHYPQRILAVYIRNVSLAHVSQPGSVQRLAKDVPQPAAHFC